MVIAIMVVGLILVALKIVAGLVGFAVGGAFKLVGCLFMVLAIGAALAAALPLAVIAVVVLIVVTMLFRR